MADIVDTDLFEPLIQYFVFVHFDGTFELRCPVGMIGVNQAAWRKYFANAEFEIQQGRPWAKLSGRFRDPAVTDYLINKIKQHDKSK